MHLSWCCVTNDTKGLGLGLVITNMITSPCKGVYLEMKPRSQCVYILNMLRHVGGRLHPGGDVFRILSIYNSFSFINWLLCITLGKRWNGSRGIKMILIEDFNRIPQTDSVTPTVWCNHVTRSGSRSLHHERGHSFRHSIPYLLSCYSQVLDHTLGLKSDIRRMFYS